MAGFFFSPDFVNSFMQVAKALLWMIISILRSYSSVNKSVVPLGTSPNSPRTKCNPMKLWPVSTCVPGSGDVFCRLQSKAQDEYKAGEIKI